jgi:acetyl-CoA carboxylase biotin carboxylase subunit
LREFRIIGVETSIPFHRQVMETSSFVDGSYDTAFIKTHLAMESPYRRDQADVAAIAAVLLHHQRRGSSLAVPVPHHTSSFNPWRVAGRREGVGR